MLIIASSLVQFRHVLFMDALVSALEQQCSSIEKEIEEIEQSSTSTSTTTIRGSSTSTSTSTSTSAKKANNYTVIIQTGAWDMMLFNLEFILRDPLMAPALANKLIEVLETRTCVKSGNMRLVWMTSVRACKQGGGYTH